MVNLLLKREEVVLIWELLKSFEEGFWEGY